MFYDRIKHNLMIYYNKFSDLTRGNLKRMEKLIFLFRRYKIYLNITRINITKKEVLYGCGRHYLRI